METICFKSFWVVMLSGMCAMMFLLVLNIEIIADNWFAIVVLVVLCVIYNACIIFAYVQYRKDLAQMLHKFEVYKWLEDISRGIKP